MVTKARSLSDVDEGVNFEVHSSFDLKMHVLMGIKASLLDPHGVLQNWDVDSVDPEHGYLLFRITLVDYGTDTSVSYGAKFFAVVVDGVTNQASTFAKSFIGSIQRCRLFSSAPSQTNENETVESTNEPGNSTEANNAPQTEFPDNKGDSGPKLPGYTLHERIIRPAEVGLVSQVAADNETH
ncbi:hypothetical protein L1987_30101 [Smallanthus sonchifolius]|uniref:Uncharacterized protein n=1 Tax=Smallanthus sonchifolius TaxID=185202 RepID=A0ACB9I2K3_9ASTR|nr:hypothetical protein L1987_30101 [Smallanthus sonchifolius]